MFVGALVSLIVATCVPGYASTERVTIRFAEGSSELTTEARQQITALVTPVVGDPLAEAQAGAYFPYGTREEDEPNALTLARERSERVRAAAIEAGISPDLISNSMEAVGRGALVLPSGRMDTVDLMVRVKTECHPLAALALRLNPYD